MEIDQTFSCLTPFHLTEAWCGNGESREVVKVGESELYDGELEDGEKGISWRERLSPLTLRRAMRT